MASNDQATLVLAISGQNANGILDYQSRRFGELLATMGLQGHTLSIHQPDFIAQLDALLGAGLLFAWGYAGVGSRLAIGGRNLWSEAGIPFVSVLADPPSMMPANHHVPSPMVVNGYIYREWLDMQRTLVRSSQLAAMLPLGVIPNPDRNSTPWSRRPHRMLFIKTGADPARQRALWNTWPTRLRTVLNDCANTLAVQGTGPILPIVQACLASHQIALEGNKPLLFGLLDELDTYIRTLRADTMARALLPLSADIIGDGWDHLHTIDARARFHPARHATTLDPLYAETQFLVNTTPNLGSGAHERVLRGFAARACVVSDNNDHARTHLDPLPSFYGVEWHDPDLPERLATVFHDPTPHDDRLDPALDHVERLHDPAAFLGHMRDLADVARLHPTLSCYALDAA